MLNVTVHTAIQPRRYRDRPIWFTTTVVTTLRSPPRCGTIEGQLFGQLPPHPTRINRLLPVALPVALQAGWRRLAVA
ncbi:unnamed protein product [Merluccius merluccius]